MSYSYSFENGPTFEIRPEAHRYWGIYVNDDHIITSHEPRICIEMVARHNAMGANFSDDLREYGQYLPLLGHWESIPDE
ncbi:hypothetical protein [Halodesulfovibrio aestuarii]|uniref:hypothetical protein n=1 Tax=Halodesulfovibrio aestuarii TaxID=126333 RepID=UPI0004896044